MTRARAAITVVFFVDGALFASWASLGHLTLAEPGALIGFLGPRVYQALEGQAFPPGVQTAENLVAHGLVDTVVAPDRLVARALEIAETIAAQAPLAVQASLASSRRAVAEGEAAAAAALLPELRPLMQSEDAAEGLASFLERRPAKFKGR